MSVQLVSSLLYLSKLLDNSLLEKCLCSRSVGGDVVSQSILFRVLQHLGVEHGHLRVVVVEGALVSVHVAVQLVEEKSCTFCARRE